MMKKEKPNYYIKSLKKAFKILNLFSFEEKEFGVTELSKKLNLHKSTIHHILATLESEEVVTKNNDTKKYRMGIRLFKLGSIVQHHIELREIALPVMKELSQKTGESIHLNLIVGRKRVIIEKIESLSIIRLVPQLGENLPLYAGGSGKVLLAYMTDEDIEKYFQKEKLISFTPNTITNPEKLLAHLKEIREKGYAIASGERITGATTIGAPIFNHSRRVIASISICGPTERFTDNKIQMFISLVKGSAMKISELMGYQ